MLKIQLCITGIHKKYIQTEKLFKVAVISYNIMDLTVLLIKYIQS